MVGVIEKVSERTATVGCCGWGGGGVCRWGWWVGRENSYPHSSRRGPKGVRGSEGRRAAVSSGSPPFSHPGTHQSGPGEKIGNRRGRQSLFYSPWLRLKATPSEIQDRSPRTSSRQGALPACTALLTPLPPHSAPQAEARVSPSGVAEGFLWWMHSNPEACPAEGPSSQRGLGSSALSLLEPPTLVLTPSEALCLNWGAGRKVGADIPACTRDSH